MEMKEKQATSEALHNSELFFMQFITEAESLIYSWAKFPRTNQLLIIKIQLLHLILYMYYVSTENKH